MVDLVAAGADSGGIGRECLARGERGVGVEVGGARFAGSCIESNSLL